jgi:NADH pyrophosphatase NudC (nudix superfamily)
LPGRTDFSDPWKAVRFCPGCGAKGITVRADRSVKCGRCGYHLHLNVAAAVAGLIEDDSGRILLTVRAAEPMKGMLDLPGGFVDPGEKAEDALAREIREELNLTVKRESYRYLGSFPNVYPYVGITYRTLDLAYRCSVETLATQELSAEIADARLYSPSEITLDLVGFGSIRSILLAYLRSKDVSGSRD